MALVRVLVGLRLLGFVGCLCLSFVRVRVGDVRGWLCLLGGILVLVVGVGVLVLLLLLCLRLVVRLLWILRMLVLGRRASGVVFRLGAGICASQRVGCASQADIVTAPSGGIFDFHQLLPRRAADFAVAAGAGAEEVADARKPAVTTVRSMVRVDLVVFALPNALRSEDVVERATSVGSRVDPALHDVEHASVDFAMRVSDGGVVEDADDIVENLLDGDVGMVPCVNNAGRDVFEDGGCDLAGWFVQDVGEVVFRQEGVCGVRAMRIRPHFVLMFATCIHDRGAACLELSGDGTDDGSNVWCQK